MTTKQYHVYDLVAMIDHCNPFPNENESLKAKLIKYRDNNPTEFIFNYNPNETIHTFATYEPAEDNINKLFGQSLTTSMPISSVPKLANAVKRFFVNYGDMLGITSYLKDWAGAQVETVTPSTVEEPNEISEDTEAEEEIEDAETEDNNEPYIQEFGTNAVAINELSTYNFSSCYTISYDELARMCLNQARKCYVSSKTRDMESQKAETEKRDKLYIAINKLFDLPEIQSEYASTKLDKMTIAELEQLNLQLESKFDTLKTKEIFKNGLVLLENFYRSKAPNGIPLGKSRRIVLDQGVTNTLLKSLFDVRTVSGNAFRRILDQHPLHITDGVSVGVEIAKVLFTNMHIVKRKTEEDAEEDDSEVDENEESEENEDEEESLESIEFE